MRGPKPDAARQSAKGNPGKRLTRRDRELLREREASAHRAGLIADLAATSPDPKQPPQFFGADADGAMQVWRELAPRLTQLNLLQDADRLTFAMFCVAYDTWLRACEQVRGADVVRVKTVSGDHMMRLNPWGAIRDRAFSDCLELSTRFGLTPLDRAKLLRDRAALAPGAWTNAGGDNVVRPQQGDQPEFDGLHRPVSESPIAIGAMDDLDSEPPARPH